VQLERDWENVDNRRSLLPYEARMRFAEECALHMHKRDSLRIDRGDASTLATRAYSAMKDADMEEILTDLRTCSFLTVDEEGGLEFIHRSYQEFFMARRLRQDLRTRSTSRLRERLRWEYAYFLGSMGSADNETYQQFTELAGAQVANAAFGAAEGAIVGPIRSELGWHVVRIDRIEREPGKPLAAVRSQIAERLTAEKRSEALEALADQGHAISLTRRAPLSAGRPSARHSARLLNLFEVELLPLNLIRRDTNIVQVAEVVPVPL